MAKHTKQRAPKIEALPDGTFRARVTDARTGRRAYIPGQTQEEVRNGIAMMARVRQDEALGLVAPAEKARLADRALFGPMTIERAWAARVESRVELCRAEEQAAHLIIGYGGHPKKKIEPFEGFPQGMLVEHAHSGVMASWWARCRKRYSDNTVRAAYFHLRAAVQIVADRGLIHGIPWEPDFAPPKKLVETPTILREDGEIVALLGAAAVYDDRTLARGRYLGRLAFIALLLSTGVRHSEAAALSWDLIADLDGEDPELKVKWQAPRGWRKRQANQHQSRRRSADPTAETRPVVPTKTREERTIKLAGFVATVLRWHRQKLRDEGRYRDDGPIFPRHQKGGQGKEWPDGCVMQTQALAKLCDRAGVPRVTVHQLRHTCISHHMSTAPDPARAAQFSGHGDLKTLLKTYTHATGYGATMPRVPMPGAEWRGFPGAAPVAPAPPQLPAATTRDDHPDFAAAWEVFCVRRSAGVRVGLRPQEITDWEARRGQRAARAAAAEGKDPEPARRAARRAARIEWERWLGGALFLERPEVAPEPAPEPDSEPAEVVEEAPAPESRAPGRALPPGVIRREVRAARVVEEAPAPVRVVEEAPAPVRFAVQRPPRTVLPELVMPAKIEGGSTPSSPAGPVRAPNFAAPVRAAQVVPELAPRVALSAADLGLPRWNGVRKIPLTHEQSREVWAHILARLAAIGAIWNRDDEAQAVAEVAAERGLDAGALQHFANAYGITTKYDPHGKRRRAGRAASEVFEPSRGTP